jgi:hypothetical protein
MRSIPRSVWAYVLASVFTFLWTFLPGDPFYPGWGAALFSFVLTAVLAIGIVRGSRIAWWIALLLESVTVLSIAVFSVWPPEPTVLVTVIQSIVLIALLLAPSTRRHVSAPSVTVG